RLIVCSLSLPHEVMAHDGRAARPDPGPTGARRALPLRRTRRCLATERGEPPHGGRPRGRHAAADRPAGRPAGTADGGEVVVRPDVPRAGALPSGSTAAEPGAGAGRRGRDDRLARRETAAARRPRRRTGGSARLPAGVRAPRRRLLLAPGGPAQP